MPDDFKDISVDEDIDDLLGPNYERALGEIQALMRDNSLTALKKLLCIEELLLRTL